MAQARRFEYGPTCRHMSDRGHFLGPPPGRRFRSAPSASPAGVTHRKGFLIVSSKIMERAFRSIGILALAVAAVVASPSSVADLPHAEAIGADALVVIGIDDTRDFWSKVEALPVAIALRQWFAGPTMQQDLDFQAFQLEVMKISEALGYEASIKELMSSVVDNALLVIGGGVQAAEPTFQLRMGINDEAKARKLIEVTTQRLREKVTQAADAAGTDTEELSQFNETEIEGTTAYHYAKPDGTEVVYGIADDMLLIANSQPAFQSMVAGAEPAQKLTDTENFRKTTGAIDWDDADFRVFLDADALASSGGMQLPGLQQAGKAAIAGRILPNAIEAEAVTTYNQLEGSTTAKAGDLKGTFAASPQPLIAVDYGIFDGRKTLNQLREMMSAAQMSGFDLDSMLQSFESQTGISIEQELIPALGEDIVFALNGLQPNPMMPIFPSVDLVLGAEVADEAKMQTVITKVEALLQQAFAGMSMMMQGQTGADAAPQGPQFTTMNVEGVDVRTITTGLPGLSPSHASVDGYWVISPSLEGLQAALARKRSGQDVSTSPIYNELAGRAGDDPRLSYSEVNIARILLAVMPMISPYLGDTSDPDTAKGLSFVNDVMSRVGSMASTDVLVDGMNKSYIKVQFQ